MLCTAMQTHSDNKHLSQQGILARFDATQAYCQHLIVSKSTTLHWKTDADGKGVSGGNDDKSILIYLSFVKLGKTCLGPLSYVAIV